MGSYSELWHVFLIIELVISGVKLSTLSLISGTKFLPEWVSGYRGLSVIAGISNLTMSLSAHNGKNVNHVVILLRADLVISTPHKHCYHIRVSLKCCVAC